MSVLTFYSDYSIWTCLLALMTPKRCYAVLGYRRALLYIHYDFDSNQLGLGSGFGYGPEMGKVPIRTFREGSIKKTPVLIEKNIISEVRQKPVRKFLGKLILETWIKIYCMIL
jgi:hypothetical protein